MGRTCRVPGTISGIPGCWVALCRLGRGESTHWPLGTAGTWAQDSPSNTNPLALAPTPRHGAQCLQELRCGGGERVIKPQGCHGLSAPPGPPITPSWGTSEPVHSMRVTFKIRRTSALQKFGLFGLTTQSH